MFNWGSTCFSVFNLNKSTFLHKFSIGMQDQYSCKSNMPFWIQWCCNTQVLEVQLPGKKVVNSAAFWNGLRGQKLKKLWEVVHQIGSHILNYFWLFRKSIFFCFDLIQIFIFFFHFIYDLCCFFLWTNFIWFMYNYQPLQSL